LISPLALSLLVVSAVLHAGWNLLLKQAGEKQIATWWALVAGSVCAAPLLVFIPISIASVWPYLLASAVFEALYYLVLAQAYSQGDFSLVYPIARGAAPALLALWSVIFLGERLRFFGGLGLALICLGLAVVGGSAWFSQRAHWPGRASVLLALGVAVCISLYSVIDGAAVKHNPPAAYTVLELAAAAILLTPLTMRRYGWSAVKAEWKQHWRRLLLIGVLTVAAYLLVLTVYSVAQVSYAGAIREVSIVIAALAGWGLLGEALGKVRVAGAGIVFAGILLIAWRG
jgi:drug/metabolite transporter (DMT)-like permease